MTSKMAAADQAFIYNFGSRRARQPNLVSIPPKIDILDTPDLSILRFDATFDDPTWPLIHDDCRLQKHVLDCVYDCAILQYRCITFYRFPLMLCT